MRRSDRTPADTFVVALTLAVAVAVTRPASAQVLVSNGPAYVSRDSRADSWTIGNAGVTAVVGFDAQRDFRILSLKPGSSDNASLIRPGIDSVMTLDEEEYYVGTRSHGFTLSEAHATEVSRGVRLDLTFELRSPKAKVTRSYVCYTESAAVETWTSVEATGDHLSVGDFTAWQLTSSRGTVRWQTGLQASPEAGGTFTLHKRTLSEGERLDLGAAQRASEQVVPVFAIELGNAELFGGLMWSGAWSGSVSADDAALRASVGISGFRSELAGGERFETAHGFFGVSSGAANTSEELFEFASAIRNGRPFPALVTYNTWFAYGTHIDEEIVIGEMERVARMGAEVFVVDAGWYPDTGVDGIFDFASGLGSLRADDTRFPAGLAALSDKAHEMGMKFGIWVEPARSALSLVDTEDGPEEAWLATREGKYAPDSETEPVAAQICFGGAAARRWLLDRLIAFIDEVHPDYLKWDNNFFVNCDREGHDHSKTDGNLRHTQGLYSVLAALRERFPDLIIENVSGGGNLLDFGSLRYADVGWMDDRSAPSTHVRHNLSGLSTFFPPAYLFSFVMGSEEESMRGNPDMTLLIRSRMPGVLGLTFRSGDLAESDTEALTGQIGIYKTFRDLLKQSSAALLSPQPADAAEGGWDILQERTTTGEMVLFAFQQPGAPESVTVRPVGLIDHLTYDVMSIDSGVVGEAKGRDLMNDGIEILQSPVTGAHILLLRVRPSDDLPPLR